MKLFVRNLPGVVGAGGVGAGGVGVVVVGGGGS